MKMMTMKKSQLKSINYYCPFEILDFRAWTHMTSHVTDDTHSQFNYELMNNYSRRLPPTFQTTSSHAKWLNFPRREGFCFELLFTAEFSLFTVLLSFTHLIIQKDKNILRDLLIPRQQPPHDATHADHTPYNLYAGTASLARQF